MSDKAPERHSDTSRNLLLNRCLTDLGRIINQHDPEVDTSINNGVWNRLDRLACEIEARERDLGDTLRQQADRIEALEAENARLHSTLNFISGAVNWEINPSNYTHEEVCALNAQWVEMGNTASAALAEKGDSDG